MIYNSYEEQYLNLLQDVLSNGIEKKDRTGIGIRSIFVRQLRITMNEGFPIFTTRKFNYKNPIEEFLFMIRGEVNTKSLEHRGVNIWKGNTSRNFLDKRGLCHFEEGELGEIYGFNMRNFGGNYDLYKKQNIKTGFDQVIDCINLIKNEPTSRRIIMTTHNPNTTGNAVLYSCHGVFIQFWVNTLENKLSLFTLIRSSDVVLGLGTNVAYYYLMLKTISEVCNLTPDELIITTIDTHIYLNHIENVKEQLKRNSYPLPKLKINKNLNSLKDIENLTYDDFIIEDYKFHPHIKYEMAV